MMTGKVKSIEKTQNASEPDSPGHTFARWPNTAVSQAASEVPVIPQMAGNLAMQRLLGSGAIHAKLTVSQPGDSDEQEADRIAEQLVSSVPAGSVQRKYAPYAVQRLAEDLLRLPEPSGVTAAGAGGDAGNNPVATAPAPVLRRAQAVNAPTPQQSVDDEEFTRLTADGTVARKPLPATRNGGDSSSLEQSAARAVSSPAAGRPLAAATRRFFEPRFGTDLSGIILHEGPAAATSAARLNARAFAYGSHVWLGPGERETDRRLLAHELVHVLQAAGGQGGGLQLRRYTRTNTVYLWDVYDAVGGDPAAVSEAQLRTTIEYEDYTRRDLIWRFSDTVAIKALRRSMDLFVAGVRRGRGPTYIRAGRETRAASSIILTKLDFTGNYPVIAGSPTVVTAALSGMGWTTVMPDKLVAYKLGTPPTMSARFHVNPPMSPAVPAVQVRALVGNTVVAQAAGLTMTGSVIEAAGIGGVAPIPSARVGFNQFEIRFQTSIDGGRIWFDSGSRIVEIIFINNTLVHDLRKDALFLGGLAISRGETPTEGLRRLVKTVAFYKIDTPMPSSFEDSGAVMDVFIRQDQCDSQAYLLRYLALTFGIPAEVVCLWYGKVNEIWIYLAGDKWVSFKCDRPAEDAVEAQPHFVFHALTNIGGVLHDAAYNLTGLPVILEHAPGADKQTSSRRFFIMNAFPNRRRFPRSETLQHRAPISTKRNAATRWDKVLQFLRRKP